MARNTGRNRHRTWPARWWEGDTKRSRNFATKEERDQFLNDMDDGYDPDAGRQPFSAFAQRWAEAQDWADTSRQSWDEVFKRLDRHIGNMPLESIDNLTLRGLQKKLADEDGYACKTVILTMSQAKSVMKSAYAVGAIKRDPTLGLKAPKVRNDDGDDDKAVGPQDVPSRSEVLAILAAAHPAFRAAIALGVNGLRIGEVMGMSQRQILFDDHRLVVDQQLQRIKNSSGVWENRLTLPKRGKKRTIALPQAISFVLRRHIEEYPPADDEWGGVLFRGGRGALMRRTYIYDQCWRPALVGAGLAEDRFVFHSLRHVAASAMLADSTPITAVAAHLGDTVETLQRTYAHWLREEDDVPAQVLDRVLAPVVEEREEVSAEGEARSEPAMIFLSRAVDFFLGFSLVGRALDVRRPYGGPSERVKVLFRPLHDGESACRRDSVRTPRQGGS